MIPNDENVSQSLSCKFGRIKDLQKSVNDFEMSFRVNL